jgi:predicted nucleic acid-binding protein
LIPGGRFGIAELDLDVDLARVAELVRRYADLPLGTVDASVVATAERLGLHEIATVDRRDFTVVRPAHVDAFTLLPELG